MVRTPEEILREARTIAVVGASPDPGRPSHAVMRYLVAQGYKVIPVHPTAAEVLGEPCVASLAEIDEPIDLVDVFRRAEFCPGVAEEAVAAPGRGALAPARHRLARGPRDRGSRRPRLRRE